jgi:hypothetical protein
MVVAALIILLMILFPPFHVVYAPGIVINEGYHLIFSHPKFQDRLLAHVDLRSLIIQICAVILLASVHFHIVRDKEKR